MQHAWRSKSARQPSATQYAVTLDSLTGRVWELELCVMIASRALV
jgi:hypothetical protein